MNSFCLISPFLVGRSKFSVTGTFRKTFLERRHVAISTAATKLSAHLRNATKCRADAWRHRKKKLMSLNTQEKQYLCKRSLEMSITDRLITCIAPKTILLMRNALSTMVLYSYIGATGSSRPFQISEYLKEPKRRLPWLKRRRRQSTCEV